MAKATVRTAEKQVVVTDGVVLELTIAEARTLEALLQFTGGNDESTAHKYVSSISSALAGVGYKEYYAFNDMVSFGWSGLYFTEKSKATVEQR